MKSILLFFIFILPFGCIAQDLYLRMEDSKPREIAGEWGIPNYVPNSSIYSKVYRYKSYICYNPLSFFCEDRATMSQTLPISALANYPQLKTIEEVEAMLASLDAGQALGWFRNINIYIVEILPNGTQIEVNKVTVSTRIK